MDDSNMLPNAGEYFAPSEPAERRQKRQLARSKARANKDIIQEVIARLEARSAFYGRIESIPSDVLSKQEQVGFHLAANHQTIANLQLEIDYWRGVLKDTN